MNTMCDSGIKIDDSILNPEVVLYPEAVFCTLNLYTYDVLKYALVLL